MSRFNIKILAGITLMLMISYQPTLLMAQTLDQLEAEIADIVEETEQQKEKQAEIKAEKADTEAELEDVKAEIDQINTNIESEQAKIDSKNAEIESQKGKIEDIQAQIPEAEDEAGNMLVTLQKIQNSNIMVQMVATPTEDAGSNVLRRIDSMNRLSEYAGGVVLQLVELERELQYEKTMLDKQLAELEQNETSLESEQANLAAKEEEFKQVLANQSESISDLDVSVDKSAEDQKMMEDTLAYYQSLGCSGTDAVGSKCGILADDDGDGLSNQDDSCPNEYGEQADGCPIPEVVEEPTPDSTTDTSVDPDVETNPDSSDDGTDDGSNSTANTGSTGELDVSTTGFARPMSSGVVTCEYACYSGHVGIDLDLVDYAPILATSPGVVTTASGGCDAFADGVNGCNGGYGNYVMVTHYSNGGVYFSLYAHLASISVSQGQTVGQGQQIGLLGDSGNSAGSHLHFELYPDSNGNGIPDDYKTNPRNYVSFPATGVYW